MRFSLLIEYDGTEYAGWQIQNGQRTIQGEIEKALKIIYKETIKITGAGRTDSGVHAKGQVAHFDIKKDVNLEKLQNSLNGLLLNDIRIKEIFESKNTFHARYEAKWREYHYYIAKKPSALNNKLVWHIPYLLDIKQMQKASRQLLGKNNFKCFCRTISDVKNYICLIKKTQWLETEELLIFKIIANRFLHGMVRAIVGTLVDIGKGKLDSSVMKEILESKDRSKASQSAPAKGLILEKVYY